MSKLLLVAIQSIQAVLSSNPESAGVVFVDPGDTIITETTRIFRVMEKMRKLLLATIQLI